jgi:3-deoxy-D-manno-octulosonate 8-phosphate phosphatase (KDO 8-P phosphatase)
MVPKDTNSRKKEGIRLLVMDIDGTLTDGKMNFSAQGEMFKAFDVKDGYGIHDILPANNIVPAVITGGTSAIVERRCRELEIPILRLGARDKLPVLRGILEELSMSEENVAYIGDDDNDLECMRFAALAGCPADASASILAAADFVSSKNGGDAAVRDFIEWLCERGDARGDAE